MRRFAAAAMAFSVACSSPSEPERSGDPPDSTDPTGEPQQPGADLVLHGGVVITVDESFSVAGGVAITDGRIVAVGSSSSALDEAGAATRVVDLEGRALLPGFVDPHLHYIQNQTPAIQAMIEDQRALFEWGRTTVGLPAAIPLNLGGYAQMLDAGDLEIRLHAYLSYNNSCGELEDAAFWDEYTFDRSADRRLAIAGVKVFMDGGGCGAPAVSFDFDDAPVELPPAWTGNGDLYVTAEELGAVVDEVDARGGQVVAHAIGDRAVEAALEGFAQALEGGSNPHGHRMDHITFLRPEFDARFGELGLNAVVWGIFNSCLEPDMGWASFLDEEQLSWLRRHRMLLDANPEIEVAFHSDAPHTEGNPFHQMLGLTELAQYDEAFGGECARPSWLDGHQVTIEEAIRMMTIEGARVMGIDHEVGSIVPGKRADLVVVGSNPLDQSGFELLENGVSATFIEGVVVWCEDAPLCEALE